MVTRIVMVIRTGLADNYDRGLAGCISTGVGMGKSSN
jgi:hypothetical protein